MEEARKRECIFAFFGLAIVDAVATIVIGISLHGDEGILIPIFIGFFWITLIGARLIFFCNRLLKKAMIQKY